MFYLILFNRFLLLSYSSLCLLLMLFLMAHIAVMLIGLCIFRCCSYTHFLFEGWIKMIVFYSNLGPSDPTHHANIPGVKAAGVAGAQRDPYPPSAKKKRHVAAFLTLTFPAVRGSDSIVHVFVFLLLFLPFPQGLSCLSIRFVQLVRICTNVCFSPLRNI